MKRLTLLCLGVFLLTAAAPEAFAWRGGAGAVRGPMGGGVARGPMGGAPQFAVRWAAARIAVRWAAPQFAAPEAASPMAAAVRTAVPITAVPVWWLAQRCGRRGRKRGPTTRHRRTIRHPTTTRRRTDAWKGRRRVCSRLHPPLSAESRRAARAAASGRVREPNDSRAQVRFRRQGVIGRAAQQEGPLFDPERPFVVAVLAGRLCP